MANTYSQIYIHAIFATKGRLCLINDDWEKELYSYIGGIINNLGCKTLIVNGYRNHVHAFFELKPHHKLSDIIRDVKCNSSKFLNENNYFKCRFEWQEGFGSFSYSHSQIENVYNYVLHQKEHHREKTFKEEYIDFLRKFNVPYNEKYLFDFED